MRELLRKQKQRSHQRTTNKSLYYYYYYTMERHLGVRVHKINKSSKQSFQKRTNICEIITKKQKKKKQRHQHQLGTIKQSYFSGIKNISINILVNVIFLFITLQQYMVLDWILFHLLFISVIRCVYFLLFCLQMTRAFL